MRKYLGVDLGASAGRAIVGILEGNILKLDEIYRFSNGGIRAFNSLYWDTLRLYQEILTSIKNYAKKYGDDVDGIGIDTWGVDFVLLDSFNEPVGFNHHYRDKRTDGMLEEMFKVVPKEEIFNQTGIQFMPLNSSTQLFSMVYNKSPQLSITKTFLMMPDFFNFLLSGVKCSEYSIATTSQLFNPINKDWAYNLIKKLKLKPEWFCKIVKPGTMLGKIQENVAEEVGLNKNIEIIAPACHDTGSAVASVPVDMNKYDRGEWAYLSSGTWSLLGVELEKPLINKIVQKYNFTNEGGVDGTIRFLKNITGLWLIQECKRAWDDESLNLSWDDIMQQVEDAPPFKSFINPDDPIFLNPHNIIDAIKNYCKSHAQQPPETIGEISRTIFESLAFRYKQVIEYLEDITKNKIKILHIIGGGSQNSLLNQFASNALNLPIEAGPGEATVIGNILVQAMATNQIDSLQQLRNVVRNSFLISKYTPRNTSDWQTGYKVYLKSISNR